MWNHGQFSHTHSFGHFGMNATLEFLTMFLFQWNAYEIKFLKLFFGEQELLLKEIDPNSMPQT